MNLFDSSLLYGLDFSQCTCSFNPAVKPESPGDSLVMRSLQIDDYDKGANKLSCFNVDGASLCKFTFCFEGYLQLLAQLTVVGEVNRSRFQGLTEKE